MSRLGTKTGGCWAPCLFLFVAASQMLGCEAHPAPPEPKLRAERDVAVVDSGCPHQRGGSCSQKEAVKASSPAGAQWFGRPFAATDAPEVELQDLLARAGAFHDQQVIVEGHVRRSCSRRGCWMEISLPADPTQTCRVTFQDYGFLVPTDAAGSDARLLGKVQVTVIPIEAVRHYESEGAHFPHKNQDGTAREVRIVATGVELTRPS